MAGKRNQLLLKKIYAPSRIFTRTVSSSVLADQRRQILLKIYAPFAKLEKNSLEYRKLALSGRVWEDYHRPADSEKYGYTRLQKV
jgi:hypothetical protein